MGLYQITITTYWLIALIYALFNKKAKQFVAGRKNVFRNLKARIPSDRKIIWVHCASLGEFEQGRPLIDQLKKEAPEYFILLTFFSPSGYEVRKNYSNADYVCYLPMDTRKNAKQFIRIVKPSKVLFVKYEFWLNYIDVLHKEHIPFYLVSGIFRKQQQFFQWYGKTFRKRLHKFNHFFLQNKTSALLLKELGINKYTVAGDTRFDRVKEITNNLQSYPNLEAFSKEALVILAGSSWPAGEKMLAQFFAMKNDPNLKLIIAPHQVHDDHINEILSLFPEKPALWTDVEKQTTINSNILVVDTIGILSSLYQYADIAYIGGGFGKGIHNTLEAATFGIPVIFGPNYQRFREAVDLKEQKGAFAINNFEDFEHILDQLIRDKFHRQRSGENARHYVQTNTGATKIIMNSITGKESGLTQ